MMKIDKILFPCDFTENSSKILPYALSMAEKYNSQVYILYVDELHKKAGATSFPTHLLASCGRNP
jgi:nucleotide-binding universal stress UspA family protein